MRSMLIWLLMGVVLASGIACKKDESQAKELRLGVNVPLSGSLTPYGKGARDGAELAVKQINDAGGIGGKKIVLFVEDNKGDTTSTRNAFKKLAEIDNVVAVIGPVTSTCALGAKMDADKDKVPMISPTATNDTVTANTQYVFRACFNDSFQGKIVANYALKQLGLKKAAVMTDQNSDYSKGLSASFKAAFEAGGGQVTAEEGYQQKDTDFGTQLVKIKNSGAQIIFVPGYPPEVPLIIKQAKVVGFDGRLCGADGWDSEAVIARSGDNIEGCFLVGAFSPEDDRPIVKDFVDKMQAATGRMPGSFEALGYDSVLMFAEAARKGGPTREGVRKALHEIKDLEAVTGRITVNERNDAEKNAVVLQIVKQGDGYGVKFLASVAP
jgi:branched-chain amino acid transport system substrate-binding protein